MLNYYETPCLDDQPVTPPNGIFQRPFPPQFNTISSTFKPQTYGGGQQRHVIAGPAHYGTIGGDRCIISYHKAAVRFPAHSAALTGLNRTTDYGYFTDDRRHSDTDSNSPIGTP